MKYLRHVFRSVPVLLGLLILGSAPYASAQVIPAGCSGSGVSISIFGFFADGTTGINQNTPVTPCETIVYKTTLGYNPQGPGINCAFESGHLVLKTPDGVEHDVTPPAGIFDPNNGVDPLAPNVPDVHGLDFTYVVNTADLKCINGTNDGTTCTSNADCTGGGTCELNAVVSYNLSGNFTKGISFNGSPPGVGDNFGGNNKRVEVAPCPTGTFCAPEICDPTATDPINFPGRTGLCEAGTAPMCTTDNVCLEPFCNTGTQMCDTRNKDPLPAICTKVCGNRGMIRRALRSASKGIESAAATSSGSLDKMSIALRPHTTDPIDPTGKDVTVLMATGDGQFFSATLPAGSLKRKGQYYKYTNKAAATEGGISRLTIWRKLSGGNQIYVDAYGDLSGAQSVMDSAVVVGNIQYNHDGTWRPVTNGWKFP